MAEFKVRNGDAFEALDAGARALLRRTGDRIRAFAEAQRAAVTAAVCELRAELRKALLPPKEGVAEDGTPCNKSHSRREHFRLMMGKELSN